MQLISGLKPPTANLKKKKSKRIGNHFERRKNLSDKVTADQTSETPLPSEI